MSYSVACGCGRNLTIEASQAGTTLSCICGRAVEIPRLSALRARVGEAPYKQNAVERIKAKIAAGELPSGDICPYSSRPADTTIYVKVQCEQSWTHHYDSTFGGWVVFLVLGWWASIMYQESRRPAEERGRDTAVTVPIRIAREAWPSIKKLRRQKSLKNLLNGTAIYAELLHEFPQAKVVGVTCD